MFVSGILFYFSDSIIDPSSINLKTQINSFTIVVKTTRQQTIKAVITLITTTLTQFDRVAIFLLLQQGKTQQIVNAVGGV